MKLGLFAQINQKVNQFYLIHEIDKLIDNQVSYEEGHNVRQMGKLNSESEKLDQSYISINHHEFIENQNLLESFQESIILLSQFIFHFWTNVVSTEQNIQDIIKTSILFSNQLQLTQKAFQELIDKNDSNTGKIYQQYAVIHKELFNDRQAYELYMQKHKHILSLRNIYNRDLNQKKNQYNDVGVLLVSANQSSLGKILKCNEYLYQMTGYAKVDIKYSSYEVFLNKLIGQCHRNFMSKFFSDGQSTKINKRKINQFILKKDGYVIPTEISIKYHYNDDYGYSFIALFHPITEFHLDNQNVSIDELIFLLCDNINGKVFDISQNATKYLKIRLDYIQEDQCFLNRDLEISDLLPIIDIPRLNETSESKEIQFQKQYSGEEHVNLSFLNQQLGNGMVSSSNKYIKVKYHLFQESYSNHSFQMNIVMIRILNLDKEQMKIKNNEIINTGDEIILQNELDEFESHSFGSQAHSHDSSQTSTKYSELIKNQELTNKSSLPRKLKIVLQLVLCMFLTIIVVSIINLNLQQTKFQRLISNIEVVKKNFEKIFYSARFRMSIRILINAANDVEPKTSLIIPDKINYVYGELFKGQAGLLTSQLYIDNANFDYSQEFGIIAKSSYIPLEYMNDQAYTYTQNHTMSYTIATVSSKTLEVYNMKLNEMNGRLDIQTLDSLDPPFKPTENEKTIFFVIQNGNNAMRQYNFAQADSYASDVKLFAQDNIKSMMITMIISLSTIFGVYLIITPIVATIFDKQYASLKLFLQLPEVEIKQCLQKSKAFYESVSYQEDTQNNDDIMITKKEEAIVSSENIEGSVYVEGLSMSYSNTSQMTLMHNSSIVSYRKERKPNPNQTFGVTTQIINSGNQKLKATHQIQNSQEEKKDEEKLSDNDFSIFTRIDKEKSKRRYKMVILNLVTITILSIYFVGSFLMSYESYSQIDYIITSLITIYFKDSCLENAMIYLRENQNRNYTVIFPENGDVASTSFINKCLMYENLYRQIRKDNHPAFEYASQYMDMIESEQICDYIYKEDNYRRNGCKNSYNGVLKQGVSNTNQLILQFLQKQDLKFLMATKRDKKFLLELNFDKATVDLIEMKVYLLDKIFTGLKDSATSSVNKYFEIKTNQYVILFGCFITILIIFIILFLFALFKVKNYLYKVNLTLRILPLECLNKNQIEELENFLKN